MSAKAGKGCGEPLASLRRTKNAAAHGGGRSICYTEMAYRNFI